VKIGVVDTGVNPSLADFAGKIDPASRDVAANRGIVDNEGHGTAVSAVALAARNGSGVEGVAFDAILVSLNTANPNDCSGDDGCTHGSVDIAHAIDLAREAGVRVINISLGGSDPSSAVNQAVARAAAAGIVIVMSAGNEGDKPEGANPEGFALSASAAGNVIIAGAVDGSHNITAFSNRAGSGQAVYLGALGSRVTAPDQTGALFLWSGTSFSAPVISGAAALLASAFPNLTGKQIIDLLLGSADDAGAPGIDPIYGRGVLNIGRAFAPQGTLSLPGSQIPVASTAGTGSPATGDATPKLVGMVILDGYSRAYVMDMADALAEAAREQPLAAALQPGLHTATAGARNVAVSITMARNPFGAPQVGFAELGLTRDQASRARFVSGLAVSRLGRRTAVALGLSETARTLQQRLTAQSQHAFLVARDPLGRMGFQSDSAGSLGLRQQVRGVGVTLTAERGRVWQGALGRALVQPGYSIAALALDRRFGPATVTLGASRLSEQDTLLGARFTAMLGAAGGTSWFADASASLDLGRGWDLAANYRRGWTAASGGVGLATGGRLSTDAWNLDVAKRGAFRAGDRLALRVMQPLRVRSGGIDLRVPVSYDYATLTAGYESRLFNLAPTGREIDLEAAYAVPLLGGELAANAFARRQPGNVAAIDRDLGAAIRFTLGF
jgi:hypothetical protein